jgi:7,8-dihydropterin-6-yl-methyl-4-(beta-D-ribofuranosyl)aminobenzene 5'-phosphate synthase
VTTFAEDYIAPGHCTGEPTFTALQKVFGDCYLYAGLGTALSMCANPRTASNQDGAPVLDDGDSRSYRALLAQSDDLHETGVCVMRLARIQ